MDTDRVLAVTIPLRSAGYSDAAAEAFYERALAELARIPGVERSAAAHSTPFAPSQRSEISLPGVERSPVDQPELSDLLHGHAIVLRDDGDEDHARPRFHGRGPGRRASGHRARGCARGDVVARPGSGRQVRDRRCADRIAVPPCREVVGVATNTRRFVSTADFALRYYVPLGQRVLPMPPQALFVRAAGDPAELVGRAVRAALLRVADNLPYAQMRVLREMAEPESRPWRLGSTLFVAFGAAALFVATAGRVRAPQRHRGAALPRDRRQARAWRQPVGHAADGRASEPGVGGGGPPRRPRRGPGDRPIHPPAALRDLTVPTARCSRARPRCFCSWRLPPASRRQSAPAASIRTSRFGRNERRHERRPAALRPWPRASRPASS